MGLFVQLDLELKLGLGAWKSDAIYELWQCNSTRLSPIMNSAYSRHCLQQCLIFSSLSIFCSHWKWMVGFFYGQPVSSYKCFCVFHSAHISANWSLNSGVKIFAVFIFHKPLPTLVSLVRKVNLIPWWSEYGLYCVSTFSIWLFSDADVSQKSIRDALLSRKYVYFFLFGFLRR